MKYDRHFESNGERGIQSDTNEDEEIRRSTKEDEGILEDTRRCFNKWM